VRYSLRRSTHPIHGVLLAQAQAAAAAAAEEFAVNRADVPQTAEDLMWTAEHPAVGAVEAAVAGCCFEGCRCGVEERPAEPAKAIGHPGIPVRRKRCHRIDSPRCLQAEVEAAKGTIAHKAAACAYVRPTYRGQADQVALVAASAAAHSRREADLCAGLAVASDVAGAKKGRGRRGWWHGMIPDRSSDNSSGMNGAAFERKGIGMSVAPDVVQHRSEGRLVDRVPESEEGQGETHAARSLLVRSRGI